MILESLIKDERKITFDCAKATMRRGSKIEIADEYWKSKEIQNAIKMGLVAIVGPEPILPQEPMGIAPEKKIRFRNNHPTKLCFECIRDYVESGKIVWIPGSKIDEPEIRNAIFAGWLTNEDNPEATPQPTRGPAIQLEELTIDDIINDIPKETAKSEAAEILSSMMNFPSPKPQPLPEGVPLKRPVKNAESPIKAKKIASAGESDDDSGGEDLFKPSEVIVPKKPMAKRPFVKPEIIKEESVASQDDDFDFTDIFSNNQPKKK